MAGKFQGIPINQVEKRGGRLQLQKLQPNHLPLSGRHDIDHDEI